jgi:ferredoxin
MFVGVFEYTMMRMGPDAQPEVFGPLFAEYLEDGTIFAANCEGNTKVSILRALPYEETVADHVEILDYERASEVVDAVDSYALSPCSCRHEKEHAGGRDCEAPLMVCTTFGRSADYMIRHDMARPASRSEIEDTLARSRELGLVMSADNVQDSVGFICNCCSCCCNLLLGISRHGFANNVVTSSYIARSEVENCKGCGKCADACPIDAIEMKAPGVPKGEKVRAKDRRPRIDESLCIGCGVCALSCNFDGMKLHERGQRVIHPETTFRRVILQCLERGTLQYQLFDEPDNVTHQVMRGVVGGFLQLPPVKKALMTDTLRSRFLDSLESFAKKKIGREPAKALGRR